MTAPAPPTDTCPQCSALYRERAHLAAFLTLIVPSVLAFSDPHEPACPVLTVHSAEGQMTWHIHPQDLPLFDHVPRVAPTDPRAQWDGHTTEEKYARLTRLIRRLVLAGVLEPQPGPAQPAPLGAGR